MKTRVRAIAVDLLLNVTLVFIVIFIIGLSSFSDFIRKVMFRAQVAGSWIRKPFG